ncbi:MAG: arsenate reductase ArsC, partial [bacterium]
MGKKKIKILFLCSANSSRSQMAEGWARALKGDALNPYSAGIASSGLNASAVKVMDEAGVSIERQISKSVDDVRDILFGYVAAVCNEA